MTGQLWKKECGLLVAISSPSGGGKTTIIRRLLGDDAKKYAYSISMTTRPKRPNEVDGKDYWFVDEAQFNAKVAAGELIEFEQVHGYNYGTPKAPLEKMVAAGETVLMDIDVYGAFSIRKHFPDKSLLIFLKPPDLDVLKKRLQGRNTEKPELVERRLTRVAAEMALAEKFDHIVVNDKIEKTVSQIKHLIEVCHDTQSSKRRLAAGIMRTQETMKLTNDKR